MSSSAQFMIRWRGRTTGPFKAAALMRMLDEHEIGMLHEVQSGGRWITIEEFLEEEKAAQAQRASPARKPAIAPPPLPIVVKHSPRKAAEQTPAQDEPADEMAVRRAKPKRFWIFAALGVTLGFAGAHNFYAGYRGAASAQILLTIATWFLGFGIMAAWLWALMELFLVHTDGRGVRMK